MRFTRHILATTTPLLLPALLTAAFAAAPAPTAADPTALHIYFADVEGGQATLFVTPQHESLLIDTGWPGANSRDAKRILALCTRAGVQKIDTVLLTHYHDDHVGGVPQLAALIPIGRFLDHGENREDSDAARKNYAAYQQTLLDHHIPHQTLKVGDVVSLQGLRAEVVSADGQVLTHPLAGGGAGKPNPACARSATRPAEDSENDRSLGLILTFGKLRIADLGDLTWAKERPLMCPIDNLGRVDLYVVSHHGMDRSGSPALLEALAPRVAIMDNGATKGGSQPAWQVVSESPRIANGKGALWQLHTATASDAAHNVPPARIANLPGPDDAGYSLEITAQPNGHFAVLNERTGHSVLY